MEDSISRQLFVQDVTEKPGDREEIFPNEWMPVTYIWPEFDGMLRDDYEMERGENDELFDEWGNIVAQTFSDFTRLQGLNIVQCNEQQTGWFGRKKREIKDVVMDAEHVMLRSTMGGDISNCLITSSTAEEIKLRLDKQDPDWNDMMPLGVCGFTLGYEVCDVDIWFREHKDTFFSCLNKVADKYGYSVETNSKVYKYSLRK